MHIVCCLKQVPDTAQVKIDPETNTLVRSGIESILNPYDLVALEQAVRIKEKHGGTITALTMGPPQASSILRQAISMGADEVYLLSDRAFAGADTLATSYTLAMAIVKLGNKIPVDLILCGKQAIDGDTAQTGPGIATRLKYTQLTYVSKIQWIDPEKKKIQVERKVDGGVEVVVGDLPALLTVEIELARPRRASLPALIASFKAPVPVWDVKAIEAVETMVGIKGSPTWVRKISSPAPRQGGPRFRAEKNPEKAVAKCLEVVFTEDSFFSNFKQIGS
ncbi:MAG: electron transfer flavoprotein subunit beta/FixA family protein [Desulfobacterales bacterium]